jgi:hypothetical protein
MDDPPNLHDLPTEVVNALIAPVMEELPMRMTYDAVQDDIVQLQLRLLHEAGFVISARSGEPLNQLVEGDVRVDGQIYTLIPGEQRQRLVDKGKLVEIRMALLKRTYG